MSGLSESQGSEKGPNGRQLVSVTPPSGPATSSGYGYGGAYPSIGTETTGLVAKLFEFWWILKKRKWVVLSVLLAFLAIGVLLTLMTTRNVRDFIDIRREGPWHVQAERIGELNRHLRGRW
jgi:hypothetical protein